MGYSLVGAKMIWKKTLTTLCFSKFWVLAFRQVEKLKSGRISSVLRKMWYTNPTHSPRFRRHRWDLVGGIPTPLKNTSQLGWLFPMHAKIRNVPNHQSEIHIVRPTDLHFPATPPFFGGISYSRSVPERCWKWSSPVVAGGWASPVAPRSQFWGSKFGI